MKIVIIGRAIYPNLAPRSFRATELAKEMSRLGHDVTLYGVLGDFDYSEFTSQTGVKVRPIRMRLSTLNSDGKSRNNLFDKVGRRYLRRWLEYPDIEFCWKIPQSLKREKDIDILITIALPFPIHWGTAIAKKLLKSKFPKVWISDCGDPYMGNTVAIKHPFYFKWIEKFWGDQTDYVTIPIAEARGAYQKNVQEKIRVIPQGFELTKNNLPVYVPNETPHFAYAGTIYIGQRDPTSFLNYLCSISQDFVFTVYTRSADYYQPFKERLGNKLIIHDYIPRDQLLKDLCSQDFLINLKNPNAVQSPSKLIDYYLSDRPILDISTPFNEREGFQSFLEGNYKYQHPKKDISCYDIKNIAKQFLDLMK